MLATTEPLRRELAGAIPARPFALQFWDGSELPATANGGPVFTVRSPTAVAHLLRAPNQLGLGRAYAAGELTADDLDRVIALMDTFQAPPLSGRRRARLLLAALRACGLTWPPPRVPASELRPHGRRHSRERDERAVRHHYDVSNDFFGLFLDDSMTYSCALFSRGAQTLEDAQHAKRELVCTKLRLGEGERVLDVGCGWGSFVIHAAREHGVHAVGVTLSAAQAELAEQRVRAAGLEDKVEIHVADYRELAGAGSFDAIASIGMVEHVGSSRIDEYARRLSALLRPGGRLLNHGIARLRHGLPEAGPFSERYVFPDAAPLHLSRIQTALERAGFETEHVEGLRQDYVDTLSAWIDRLDANRAQAERLAGGERLRVWRLYLRAARRGFSSGFMSVYQVLARRAG